MLVDCELQSPAAVAGRHAFGTKQLNSRPAYRSVSRTPIRAVAETEKGTEAVTSTPAEEPRNLSFGSNSYSVSFIYRIAIVQGAVIGDKGGWRVCRGTTGGESVQGSSQAIRVLLLTWCVWGTRDVDTQRRTRQASQTSLLLRYAQLAYSPSASSCKYSTPPSEASCFCSRPSTAQIVSCLLPLCV
jgi:hypothetical protein